MPKQVIRSEEEEILKKFFNSSRSEFMAVYGRRRVGKTFLIKNFFSFKKCAFFHATGIESGTFLEQRSEFCQQISNVFYNGISVEVPKTWYKVFDLLNKTITGLPKTKKIGNCSHPSNKFSGESHLNCDQRIIPFVRHCLNVA